MKHVEVKLEKCSLVNRQQNSSMHKCMAFFNAELTGSRIHTHNQLATYVDKVATSINWPHIFGPQPEQIYQKLATVP